MSLFTDSDILVDTDLTRIDSELTTVVANESIVLDGDNGAIRLAWDQAATEILSNQQLYDTMFGYPGVSGIQNQAVFFGSSLGTSQARCRLNQVVVDSSYGNALSPLKQWVAYYALTMAYRNASSRLLQDRYDAKAVKYEKETGRRWAQLRFNGLPIVYRQLEAPGATHGFNPGTWGTANLSATASGSAAQVAVTVCITYCDLTAYVSPTVKGNAESGPSAPAAFTIPASNVLTVSISSLNPSTGKMDPIGNSEGISSPLTASAWNVYCSVDGKNYWLQNATPIPIATKTYTLAGTPTLTGTLMGTGQYADRVLLFTRMLSRG